MHTSLISGWSSSMLLFELILVDISDSIFNPIWRQSCYVLPIISRLSVIKSYFGWSIGNYSTINIGAWVFEIIFV